MTIVEYQEQYKQDFLDLNLAWVEKYFSVEHTDWDTLYCADRYIEKGGMIFFAVDNGKVLATCMVFLLDNNVWEISKLAANEKYQGRGAGSAVLNACMNYAVKHGAEKIVLETNHILKPAVHIYEKYGFKRVPLPPCCKYIRADLRYEYVVPNNLSTN